MFFWREHEKFLNKKKLYEKEAFSYAWRIESDQKGFLKKKKKRAFWNNKKVRERMSRSGSEFLRKGYLERTGWGKADALRVNPGHMLGWCSPDVGAIFWKEC